MKKMATTALDALAKVGGNEKTTAYKTVQEALQFMVKLESILFDKKGRNYVTYDRLKELVEADADGRILTMPCHIGDKMYRVYSTPKANGKTAVMVRDVTLTENNFYRIVFEEELGRVVFPEQEKAYEVANKLRKELKARGELYGN